ncbi:MAG: hypothetical protein Q9212_007478, partial [Teloschistes hypoglaucus]
MQNTSTYEQELAIVYRERNGRATLVPLTINSTDSGRQIFEKIRDKQRAMSTLHSRLTSLLLLLARYEVATAEIRWTLYSTSENKNDGIRVDLGNREKDNLLTEALHYPRLLADEPAFILNHDSLSLQRKGGIHSLAGQQVLLIDTVGDKVKMAWLLLLADVGVA